MANGFPYHEAFSRNIGWVTTSEQEVLRHKRIAIAGMGGVGGVHLLTLARLGVGAFNIADFDVFDIANFNRQAGASMSSLGKPKAEVMAALAKDINPDLDIKIFPLGISEDNLSEFFTDVDLYVDGLDFFVFSARQATFAACAELGIPAITAAPLGMGTAVINFLPGKMTFEEYFQLGELPDKEKALRFLLGLAPAGLHFGYLVDPSRVDLANHRGPSTIMACQLCAGAAATEALKILLNRGKIRAAPHGLHFDAYRGKLARTWRPGGNSNPLQRLMLTVIRQRLSNQITAMAIVANDHSLGDTSPSHSTGKSRGEGENPATLAASQTIIEQILDLARWAPSGDNTQPWRFEILGDNHILVHGFDTRDHVVYDLDGHASQLAVGALLETIAIAATGEGRQAHISRRPDTPDDHLLIDVRFESDASLTPDPLIPSIAKRVVQRRPMSTRPLTPTQKSTLEGTLPDGYRVLWYEGLSQRWRLARFMFDNAKIRLIIPEAYEVHRAVIEWGTRFSEDKIPDQAVGIDPLTARFMRWAMVSWERVDFLNRWLLGDLPPRIQLDLLPGLACTAHFALLAPAVLDSVDDYLAAGRVMQRFWLAATSQGLYLQPEMTPVIFTRYHRHGWHFTQTAQARALVENLNRRLLEVLAGQNADTLFFMGRMGFSPPPRARSTRLPLDRLVLTD